MISKLDNFKDMGGRESLILINKIFYDKVYAHPWLKLYFEKIPQDHIEIQQVDFMQKVLGGENIYVGKAPPLAHMHIHITEELFDVREALLKESFIEANATEELSQMWLKLDRSFKRTLLKKSENDCQKRFMTDPILSFPKP